MGEIGLIIILFLLETGRVSFQIYVSNLEIAYKLMQVCVCVCARAHVCV